MRKNLPVTNVEYPLSDDTLIVSKTDIKGKLVYFNDQFVAASGFPEEQLMNQPHNIVRHPDMPPEAFDDLWVTLKEGKPWAGAVKNRRKNGDFYWVLASATPIWENGKVTGYMSIRTKLPADQRAEAEHVYALLRANQAQAYRVNAGVVRRRSLFDHFALFTRTLKARLVTLISVQAAFMIVVGLLAWFGAGQFTVASGIALVALLLGLGLGGVLGVHTIRAVGRPLEQLNGTMAKIAQGQFNSRIIVERDDEIGTALRNIQAMQAKLGFDREEQKDTEKRIAVQRKADMIKLANDFEGAVGEIIETVSSASTELEASAGTLTATAERSQELTTMVAAASEEASTNVQSVASATEETDVVGQRDQPPGAGIGADGQRGRRSGPHDQRPRRRIVEGGGPHRRRGRTDQHHRRPDQPAGAQRHHRGGARRRGRSRLRGRGFRGEGAGRADREGDRRDRPADHRHPGGDPGVGRRHQGDQRHHREDCRRSPRPLPRRWKSRARRRRKSPATCSRPRRAPSRSPSNITDVQRGASETGSASSQVLSAAQSLSGDSNRLKLEVGKFLRFGQGGLTGLRGLRFGRPPAAVGHGGQGVGQVKAGSAGGVGFSAAVG